MGEGLEGRRRLEDPLSGLDSVFFNEADFF